MPRKPKDIYSRINEKEEQIEHEKELLQLNKERESLEMTEIFRTAKEHNMSFKQVIDLISKVH